MHRLFKTSLAGRIAAAVLISTTLVTAASSGAAFLAYRESALNGVLETTLAYLQERRKGGGIRRCSVAPCMIRHAR